MKLILTVIGLFMVLTFGVLAVVDNSTTADAGRFPSHTACHDDGDDDQSPNAEPVDDPDSEDNGEEEELPPGVRDDEFGDTNDQDPGYEEDDDVNCDLVQTAVLGESETPTPSPTPTLPPTASPSPTQSPSPTPCVVPVGSDVHGEGPGGPPFCCEIAGGVSAAEIDPCLCLFGAGDVVAEGPGEICCIIFPGLCCANFNGTDDINAEGPFECCTSVDDVVGEACFVSADVDCSGEVTAADAFSSLEQLSGGSEAAGACSSGGDADCSGAVDVGDTLAILKIVAGLSTSDAC